MKMPPVFGFDLTMPGQPRATKQDNANTYRALAMAQWKADDFLAAGKTYALALNTDFHSRYRGWAE